MFGFGRRSKADSRAEDLLSTALKVQSYSDRVSGADAVDFVERVMFTWNLAYGDEPIDRIKTSDDVKRELKLEIAAGAIADCHQLSPPRRLACLIVAVELQAQFIPDPSAELARVIANKTIDRVRRKAAAMIATSGGKNDGESDADAVMRHINIARYTGDPEKSRVLIEAAANG